MRVDEIAVASVALLLYVCRITALDVNRLNLAAFEHLYETVFRALIVYFGGSCQFIRDNERDDDEKYNADDDECASCGWFHLSS